MMHQSGAGGVAAGLCHGMARLHLEPDTALPPCCQHPLRDPLLTRMQSDAPFVFFYRSNLSVSRPKQPIYVVQ